jgi:membrane-associated phospholipid phosphatase
LFQTDPNLWLQTFSWPPLRWLLSGVTLLGYLPVYVALLLVLAFAFRLRPSLAVIGGVLLCGLLTEAAKDAVAFPRPDEVDSRIRRFALSDPVPVASRGGGVGFWALPSSEAIAAVRARGSGNYGFPSGHVSAATAFLLCSAAFFGRRRLLAAAAVWVPLMALSRLYLGRHFLADVLGGLFVGLLATGVALVVFHPLGQEEAPTRRRAALAPMLGLGALTLALAPFVPVLDPRYAGALVALVASCAWIERHDPARLDGGPPRRRVLRVALAGTLFSGAGLLVRPLLGTPQPQAHLGPFVACFALVALTLAGTASLARRLGLTGD